MFEHTILEVRYLLVYYNVNTLADTLLPVKYANLTYYTGSKVSVNVLT